AVLALQAMIRKVPCSDMVIRYATRLTRMSRRDREDAPSFVRDYIAWGAGPRASQNLVLAGKARAILKERHHVTIEDIRAVARPVLRHRLVTNFNAEAEGIDAEQIVAWLIDQVPADVTPGLDAIGGRKLMAG
ncbi:MAG: AAA family ATPase, partial [Phycisphaerae bacterium]